MLRKTLDAYGLARATVKQTPLTEQEVRLVVKLLEVIGEAVKKIPKNRAPELLHVLKTFQKS